MSTPIDPLEPDVAAVLGAARELDSPPPGTGDRVLASVAARVAALPPGGGGGGAQGNAHAVGASARPLTAVRGWLTVVGVVSFGLGVAVGVTAQRRVAPVERVVYVDRPAPIAAPSPERPLPGAVLVESLPSVPPSAAAPGAARTAAAPASSRDRLAAESALLDMARVAVAQGDGQRALQAVERHRTQFPNGVLTEEREALTIKALHLQGRDGEAHSRLAAFERAYPNSLFLPALHGVVDPPP